VLECLRALATYPELRVHGYALHPAREDYRVSIEGYDCNLADVPAERHEEVAVGLDVLIREQRALEAFHAGIFSTQMDSFRKLPAAYESAACSPSRVICGCASSTSSGDAPLARSVLDADPRTPDAGLPPENAGVADDERVGHRLKCSASAE
jgi:hypothetical protein